MTTYIYETVPEEGGVSRRYEIRQSMKDAPLGVHPETGEKIRRVPAGGYGILKSGSAARPSVPSGGHCCGGAGCGCH